MRHLPSLPPSPPMKRSEQNATRYFPAIVATLMSAHFNRSSTARRRSITASTRKGGTGPNSRVSSRPALFSTQKETRSASSSRSTMSPSSPALRTLFEPSATSSATSSSNSTRASGSCARTAPSSTKTTPSHGSSATASAVAATRPLSAPTSHASTAT